MRSFLCAVAGFAAVSLGAHAMADEVNPLQGDRWSYRPLVVVVPTPEDPVLQSLNDELNEPANREAFVEREMVLYRVVEGRATRNDKPLKPDQAAALLDALDAKPDGPATVYLIGKDGGIKVKEEGGVNAQDIFVTIDRMPMRQ
ncbi:DUF4174 domain-containing protein [Pseudomonas sp. Marseille-QA0892]